MRTSGRRAPVWVLLLTILGTGSARAEGPRTRVPEGKDAAQRLAPVVPGKIVLSLQAGDYAEAAGQLAKLESDPDTKPGDSAYFGLVRGTALRLAKSYDSARETLNQALARDPDGPWTAKLRSGLAAVEVASGRFASAETIARGQAGRLLDGDRKDRLAGVFQDFADRLLHPDAPATSPDPEGAFALLQQARELAEGDALRAGLLLRMGQASRQAGNHGRAIENFQAYLKEYPRGADRSEARFELGQSQLDAGQPVPARLTWTDLARDLEKVDTLDAQTLRARTMYHIAKTYGLPNPTDDTSLNLGVAWLLRMLESAPSHSLGATAAFEIGQSYLNRGKSEAALGAFRDFLSGKLHQANDNEARQQEARLRMQAQYLIGQILQGQQKFQEAIDAWKDYLSKFPDGPQSAEAQRAIVDTQLLIAHERARKEKYHEARDAYSSFVSQNPLDSRVPQVLFLIGQTYAKEKRWREAISAWETLAGKFPGTEPAAHARFEAAYVEEVELGQPSDAIARYKKVEAESWRSQARHRIAIMEAKALVVITPRVYRSGETPTLKIFSRNLETLTFTAYKTDPEAYFRKKHALSGVESLDIGLVQPDFEWTEKVPGYARYKSVESAYELKKLSVPGMYVVKVTDEKNLQATTLVLGSDVDAIFKSSVHQLLVFAQDMKTGQGRPGARVLVSDGEKLLIDAKTGDDGVLLTDWPEPQPPGRPLRYLVTDGRHVAGTGLALPGQVAQGLSARAYLDTDRPAYRPGQSVQLRGVVREVENGQYTVSEGSEYHLEVYDSRGRRFVDRTVSLSAFGTFHDTFPVDSAAPLGTYRIRLFQPGKSDFSSAFQVQAYQLQKISLTIDLPRSVYFRGETVEADVKALYQYGTPLSNRPIEVALPDGRVEQGQTDGTGTFHVSFPTSDFAEEQTLTLVARLPEDNVSESAQLRLAVRAFSIGLKTARSVYLDGETFPLEITTLDALGKPIGQALKVTVLKRIAQTEHLPGRVTEREIDLHRIRTDAETGKATLPLQIDDPDGGSYLVRVSGTDRFGNPVFHDRPLTISGKKDSQKLRLLADRLTFQVGETAEVRLISRLDDGQALLTWEADRVLKYRIDSVKNGENTIKWDVEGAQFPNFTLAVSEMSDQKLFTSQVDIKAERDLHVQIKPRQTHVGPGDEVEVEILTLDQLDHPVPAEVSLALVDQALLRLYQDRLPPIDQYFYNQTRTHAFQTASTNAFRYAPSTEAVSEDLVEQLERQVAMARDLKEKAKHDGEWSFGLTFRMPRGVRSDQARARSEMVPPPAGAPIPEPVGGGGLSGQYTPAPPAQTPMQGGSIGGMVLPSGPVASSDAQPPITDKELAEINRNRASFADVLTPGDSASPLEESEDLAAGAEVAASRRGAISRKAAATPPAPRQQYVETAYWNPSVVTDKQGKAIIKFKAPSALSEYRFTARGVTGSDTLVGQSTAGLSVRQDLFVDLKLPPVLREGDSPRFLAQIHHKGINGPAEIVLSLYAGGVEKRYPKQMELKGDGIEEVLFDPFDVPAADSLRLSLEVRSGDQSDRLDAEVPVRPWGVQAFSTTSGTAKDDTTEFVSLPAGAKYENPEMLIMLSPTERRMIVEMALGREYLPAAMEKSDLRIIPPSPVTLADRASDLLASSSALLYLRAIGGARAPETARLTDHARSLVGELITSQNEDGGWPWVATGPGKKSPSDRLTTTRAAWALKSASEAGLLSDPSSLEKSANYLTQQLASVDSADVDTRLAILHALSTLDRATFEQANSANRSRQSLTNASLAYLALTFSNLDRQGLAAEVLGVLGPRAKTENVAPGSPPRTYWTADRQNPWLHSSEETTALAALAYAHAQPEDPRLSSSVEWLQAHRTGLGWRPHKAKGPALAALGLYYGRAKAANANYRLTVSVNDDVLLRKDINGQAEGQALRVPLKDLKDSGENRIHFDIEGRGTYNYSITLTGFARDLAPFQKRRDLDFGFYRRVYLAADPEFEGKTLPSGFSVAINPKTFVNYAKQVPLGGRARVRIDTYRSVPANQPDWERDFLVLEEHLPAGASLVEGSIKTDAAHFEQNDGTLTFYFNPNRWPGTVQYEVYGYLPGHFRTLPPSLKSAYDPSKLALGPEVGSLQIMPPGQKPNNPYTPTPDELYARGSVLYDAGRLAEAAKPLEALWSGYSLQDIVAREAARMLLEIFIKDYDPNKVVKYFEILKEKSPDLVIPFDEIKAVGRAYADIGEHERAYLVWRATAEASYLADARVGEVLRQRGKPLEAVALLIDLWQEYPSTPSIQSDFFGLSQVLGNLASRAVDDPEIRHALADADLSRSDLLAQEIRLVQVFLALSPNNPVADEASLASLGALLDLEDFETAVKLAARFSALYPRSTYQDSFQYSAALGLFHLARYDEAIKLAEKIAASTYKDASGVERESPNKWQALYILGQIHDARHQPEQAVKYYRQVADRFSDASSAEKSITLKELSLPEISILRPRGQDQPAAGPAPRKDQAEDDPKMTLTYRNLSEVDVKVYPVDLMRLYLTRRTLSTIAGIDLAGIHPLVEKTVKLDGKLSYAQKTRPLDLDLENEGAYLVMVRGEDLYASGILLVSPLELEVLEEPDAGRVRVRVLDSASQNFVPRAQVKVLGTSNTQFLSGETDLRGIFVADGVRGLASAVARLGPTKYAFYRGTRYLGPPPPVTSRSDAPSAPELTPSPSEPSGENQSLDQNLRMQNTTNQLRQLERLQDRYNTLPSGGVQIDKAR